MGWEGKKGETLKGFKFLNHLRKKMDGLEYFTYLKRFPDDPIDA